MCKDPMQKQAETLVQIAQVNAMGMFLPLLDKFPFIREVDVDDWNFILTIAGVFIAASRLNSMQIDNIREECLMDKVVESLLDWNQKGLYGFENCKHIFEAEHDRLTKAEYEEKFIASDSLGLWIVLNVLDRGPETLKECELARTTGVMVVHAFFDWWQE